MRKTKVQVHLWLEGADGGRRYAVFQRQSSKGSCWQPITGNVDPGETAEAAALREAVEETGVRAAPGDLTPCLWVHDWRRDGQEFEESVYGLRASGERLRLSHEHQAFNWVSYAEALGRFPFEGNRRGLAFVEAWLRSG